MNPNEDEDEFVSEPDVVWVGELDGATWEAYVERIAPYRGRLLVMRMSPDGPVPIGTVVLDEEVPLTYDALFGPDIADVWDWQTKAVEAVDAL